MSLVIFQYGVHRLDSFFLLEQQERGVIGQRFHQPIVFITGRNHHVPPPLVRHFVSYQQFGIERLLWTLTEERGPLFGDQVSHRRQINQAREPLAEASWNRRDREIANRRGAESVGH